MTDKVQKIREEVERLKLCTMDEHMKFYSEAAEAEYNALCKVEKIIDSLQEEPVSEDLLKASMEFAKGFGEWHYAMPCFQAGAEWQKKQDQSTIELAEDHAMLAGMEKMKEQMMKDAVDGWVFRDIKEGRLRISDNKECWNGIRIPEKSIEKSYLFCTTDDAIKVKLVIVKED